MMNNPNHVAFFDTTLRDGEQSPGCSMTTQEKLTMAHALEDLGVDIIEAGFAMASEGDFAAIATITQAVRKPRIASLARAKSEDIEMAARALQFAERSRIHVFLASSDLHLEYKLKMSRAGGAGPDCGESVRLARSFVDDVEFSPEDATRSDRDFLVEMVRIAVEAGATTINMPDTVGYTTPGRVRPDVPRSARAHSGHRRRRVSSFPRTATTTLALRVANSLAAIRPARGRWSAPSTASASAPAMRRWKRLPRPCYVRGERYGVSARTSSSTSFTRPARCSGQIITFKPSPNKAIVGANAFAHESGIHQHGMLANPLCYEIMTPRWWVCRKRNLVLGKHSRPRGAAASAGAAWLHGQRDELQHIYYRFVALADRKKNIYDQDLIGILPDPIRDRKHEPVANWIKSG